MHVPEIVGQCSCGRRFEEVFAATGAAVVALRRDFIPAAFADGNFGEVRNWIAAEGTRHRMGGRNNATRAET
jgi:hypothetical protein